MGSISHGNVLPETPRLGNTYRSKNAVFVVVSINIYTVKTSIGERPAVLDTVQI